ARGASVLKVDVNGEESRTHLLGDAHRTVVDGNDPERGQQEPGADDRMAGERKLVRGGEDAQASESAVVRGPLHEDGLRKIHFAGDGLHALGGYAVAVGDHGEGIAGELFAGEHVQSVEASSHREHRSCVLTGGVERGPGEHARASIREMPGLRHESEIFPAGARAELAGGRYDAPADDRQECLSYRPRTRVAVRSRMVRVVAGELVSA